MLTPKQHAQKIYDKHKTNNPFKIAEQKNIILMYEDLEDIYGFYFNYKRTKFIHVNNKLPEYMQRFVCAHELGHSIQHTDLNTAYLSSHTLYSTDRLEVEANSFAVELLAPDTEITEYIKKGFTLDQISLVFGIPKKFMKYKKL